MADASTHTLKIVAWSETFENADSRKRQRLKFFYSPSGCDSKGYLALVSRFPQEQAMMALGVFQALCQLSATLGRSVRGTFKNTDGSNMDFYQLSILLRIQECHLRAAIQILTDPRVMWMEWAPSESNLPPTCQLHASFVQGQGQGQGQDLEREREAGASLADNFETREQSMPTYRRPTLDQAKSAAKNIGVTPEKADEWWHAREASGWLKGMAGGGTAPVGANWQADLKTYSSRGAFSAETKSVSAPTFKDWGAKP